ncbi:MAG: hypothetical protein ACR2PJ_04970, partial [Pseudomonadales bacterium]
MQQSKALQTLTKQDRQGRYVFTSQDLAKLFPEDSNRALQASLRRLFKNGLLTRAVNGVYV